MSNKISTDHKSAFKQADIRGVYPTEINEEFTYLVARAFVDEFQHSTVLVARDMRLSTPALHEAFCKGVRDAGADVIDLGLVHTPVLYFASGTMDLPGVVITASHSPKEYNGLKLVLAQAIPLTEQHGLKAIRKRMEKGVFDEVDKRGKYKTKNVLKAYQRFVLKGIKAKNLVGLKIVADTGNGMAGVLMPLLEEKLPIKFTTLFPELDGRFPNRGSDPTHKKNQRALSKTLKEGDFDFGVAFDGDSDRIAFLDENGRNINSSAIGSVIAERLLKKDPGASIVYTVFTSRMYEEKIEAAGGKPVPARVGHSFIKETMRKKDVIFGCEHSGHFFFKDYFFTDSVVYTIRHILDAYLEAKAEGILFSKMMEPYLRYNKTEDVLINVKDKNKSLKLVEQYLRDKNPQSVKKFDGVTVDFGDVWGTVKPSVTEYALKVMFESKSKAKAKKMRDEVVEYIKGIADS
jgi:phosphomannomutase